MWLRFLSLFLLFLTSCSPPMLTVEKYYITREKLASFHVSTPDLSKFRPTQGQLLVINWSLPDATYDSPNLHMYLTLRFRNREEATIEIPVTRQCGSYYYFHVNSPYYCKGDVVTYKAELFSDDEIVAAWYHQLYCNLITFD